MNHVLPLLQRIDKRTFDIALSLLMLALLGWLILLAWIVASIDTHSNGMFCQGRIGRWGKIFKIYKIKTMRQSPGITTTITAANDSRITRSGRWMRWGKIDELPQLFNVLIGDMSFVGPRPDVPGFADQLTGENRQILSLRPGITGPATLAFRNEEELLAGKNNPEEFNKEVIYPIKVELNLEYLKKHSLFLDFQIILATVSLHNTYKLVGLTRSRPLDQSH